MRCSVHLLRRYFERRLLDFETKLVQSSDCAIDFAWCGDYYRDGRSRIEQRQNVLFQHREDLVLRHRLVPFKKLPIVILANILERLVNEGSNSLVEKLGGSIIVDR